MRSGPIQPEVVQEQIDRREEELPLWEQGNGANIDLPWTELNRSDALNDVKPLIENAHSVVLAIGATATSRSLLDAVLQSLPAHCRLYVYGDSTLEADTALIQRIAGMGDRVLVRLGYCPPADWLIVDKGRDGRLVVGPTAEYRKWVIPIGDALARSLFEAFCVLFWFHATREALPDANGNVAFRPPLTAPFKSPSTDIPLPAGRLRLDGELDDPVPDAEIRISPTASDPGRARTLFVPPTDGLANGRVSRPVGTEIPTKLSRRGHQVLWVDTGLPRTTVTHQRMVMYLVETPVALQLEWPRAVAIDLFHRFERASQNPAWEFHPKRRLGVVKGQVLLDGETQPKEVAPSVSLDTGDVETPLLDFASVRPARFPDIPPLALEVTVQWRRVPAALPPDARAAEIVRSWTAVDEWASRTVENLRDELDELENQEGLLSRFRQWLPSRDGNSLALEREQLRDELDEIGESPPSGIADQAEERMERLVQIVGRVDGLRRTAHNQQQVAEDAKAKAAQRDIWKKRVDEAKTKLSEVQQKLAQNEVTQGKVQEELQAAQAVLDEVVVSKRQERKAFLEQERTDLEAKLEKARTHQKSLKREHKGQRSKAPRKEANKRLSEAKQMVSRNEQDRKNITTWSPPAAELGEAATRLTEVEQAISDLQADAARLSKEIENLNRVAAEEFHFDEPPRLSAPSTSEVHSHPSIPSEAPPELGELYEHRGERFLAIRTWEQLKPATPVAERLRAKLVVDTRTSKG